MVRLEYQPGKHVSKSTRPFASVVCTPRKYRFERAVAVQIEAGELADLGTVQPWSGPHGLAAVGTADAIAFIDPGRGNRGDSVPVVALPGRI